MIATTTPAVFVSALTSDTVEFKVTTDPIGETAGSLRTLISADVAVQVTLTDTGITIPYSATTLYQSINLTKLIAEVSMSEEVEECYSQVADIHSSPFKYAPHIDYDTDARQFVFRNLPAECQRAIDADARFSTYVDTAFIVAAREYGIRMLSPAAEEQVASWPTGANKGIAQALSGRAVVGTLSSQYVTYQEVLNSIVDNSMFPVLIVGQTLPDSLVQAVEDANVHTRDVTFLETADSSAKSIWEVTGSNLPYKSAIVFRHVVSGHYESALKRIPSVFYYADVVVSVQQGLTLELQADY